MSAVVNEDGERRHYGDYPGTVVDNVDPDKRGRVKIKVPGLCEPSTDWALPVGGSHSSGAKGKGLFDPPPKGASVVVRFLCGDIDSPIYEGGWRGLVGGKTDAPTEVQGASPADAANKLKVYESDDYMIVIDERAGSSALSLRCKKGDIRLEVREGKIKLGKGASEAIVKGSSWWRQQDLTLTQVIAALNATAAGCVGPAAALAPGIAAEIAAWQAFQAAGAAENFLSKLSSTE